MPSHAKAIREEQLPRISRDLIRGELGDHISALPVAPRVYGAALIRRGGGVHAAEFDMGYATVVVASTPESPDFGLELLHPSLQLSSFRCR